MTKKIVETGTFRKVQVDVAIVDFIHRLNPGESIEKPLTTDEITAVRVAVGQVLANHGVSMDAYFEGLVLPLPQKYVLTYRFGDGGLKVSWFDAEEKAEQKAVEWVKEDHPRRKVETIDDVHELECGGGFFAIDIVALLPGEAWEND